MLLGNKNDLDNDKKVDSEIAQVFKINCSNDLKNFAKGRNI